MAGNARRSLQELSAEVATNPNSTAFVELAGAYRERGDLQRALWLCLRGLQRHPTHVEAHHELGRIYEARGERELALDEWSIVRQLAPEHLPSRLDLIRLFLAERRFEDAEQELRAAEELAPGDERLLGYWRELEAAREAGPDRTPGALIEKLLADHPGTRGVMVVDGEGDLVVGTIGDAGNDAALGANLAGARRDAERVVSYLQLGGLKRIVLESEEERLTLTPLDRDTLIVAVAPEVPAGRAAQVAQRASELAGTLLQDLER